MARPRVSVLYGSQTGNSSQAAQDFCKSLDGAAGNPMELDDWLVLDPTKTQNDTDIWIIFVSSYGVGGAPLGALQFRQVCDAILEEKQKPMLRGIRYAVCGLGNSNYTTYLNNPRTIFRALQQAGATPLLEDVVACDAASDDQGEESIASFCTQAGAKLKTILATEGDAAGTAPDRLLQVRTALQDTARRVVLDWNDTRSMPPSSGSNNYMSLLYLLLALLVVAIAYIIGTNRAE